MKTIDIITHVYAEELPQYGAFLSFQLASLSHHRPRGCRVRYWLVHTPADETVQAIMSRATAWLPSNVALLPYSVSRGELFRRAVARNQIAQATDSEIVWFADADYWFGAGCLDAVAEAVSPVSSLCFPSSYFIHRNHEIGDVTWNSAVGCAAPPLIDESQFILRRSRVAIGGIQILGGREANRIGYMGGTGWAKPTDGRRPFPCFRDDSKWRRRHFPDGGTKIEIPNLYRLRHTASSLG